jgi:ribonuclease HII
MPFGLDDPCEVVVKGDATSAAIAAASIVAKVSRDRFMRRAAEQYPQFGFEQHVGYATPSHRDAIVEFGPTPIHRQSFASTAYEQFKLVA